MLASRLKVAIVLIPIAVTCVVLGGYFFLALILFMLGLAAWEFGRLFKHPVCTGSGSHGVSHHRMRQGLPDPCH